MKISANTLKNDDMLDLPRFIDSSPLGEDLLEGRSQEQLAVSVSRLIKSNRTENRLIGLDGAWGSGKSNLVKIIESKLAETHHVFYFDAWGHQEDLQRRAFLEELTADLCENEIVEPKIWSQKLKDLLSRKRETVTKTVPRLSYGIVVALLVSIITPIAKIIADGIDGQVAKAFVTASPLLAGIATWIIVSIKNKRCISLQEVFYLYKDKDLVDETQVTISEKEPSVREFQGWMGKLSEALTDKSLIVVFDNMDRLPPDRVRELWSSIHTFFAEDSFDRIWVIIPFDRAHIEVAFDSDEEVSDQFLCKSFSVIYRVALPVLTDWHKFFDLKYEEAFGVEQGEELPVIRRVYDLLCEQITPRGIIAFINELVSLRLAVEEKILLRYIAVFVLTKKHILKSPVDSILSLEFLGNAKPLFGDDPDLANHIAALVYHVPLASASQVTLTREIGNALRDRNGSRFNELAKHRHFIDILEQVLAEDDLDIPSAVATLDLLNKEFIEKADHKERVSNIWDFLCEHARKSPITEQEYSEAHELLIKNSSGPIGALLVPHIAEGIRNAEQFDGAAYYREMSRLEKTVQTNQLSVDINSVVVPVKKSPEVFCSYIEVARNEYRKFKLQCDEKELQEFIVGKIPDDLGGLEALSAIVEEYDLEPVVLRVEESLGDNSLTPENVGNFLKFYKSISTERLLKTIEDSHVNVLLSGLEAGSDAYQELLAMRLARASKYPSIRGITQAMLQETDRDDVLSLAGRIESYKSYGDLLVEYLSWPMPALKAVLRILTLSPPGSSSLNITSVLGRFKDLFTELDIAPEDFLKRLNSWERFATDKIDATNISQMITDHEFFEYAVTVECELTNHAVNIMCEYLGSLEVEEWTAPLRNVESYLFEVTYWLLRERKLATLPDNAVTVYKEILIDVAKGEFTMEQDVGWGVYYERTHKAKLKATAKNIRDVLISDATISCDSFLVLADLLVSHGDLKQQSADVVRKILAPVVSNDECLDVMIKNKDSVIQLVDDAGDDASDFKDVVRQKVVDPGCSSEVVEFARAIGVETPDDAMEDEPEQEEQ